MARGWSTSEDPVTCPTRARKLQPGETAPISQMGYGPSSPIWRKSATLTRCWTSTVGRGLFRHSISRGTTMSRISHQPDRVTASRRTTSASRMERTLHSPGHMIKAAGGSRFGRTLQCNLTDSWIIAPKDLQIPFGQGQATTTLTASFPQCPTVDRQSQSLTRWNYYADYLYQSGKRLNTIKSWHFSQNSTNSDAIEVFMFTKEIWENEVGGVASVDKGVRAQPVGGGALRRRY